MRIKGILLLTLLLFAMESFTQRMLVPFKNDKDKWGFRDMMDDKVVIKPQYDETGFSFKSGLCWVRLDKKYGFINEDGRMIVPATYDFAGEFSEGLAVVNIGRKVTEDIGDYVPGKFGFIDSTGKVVVPLQYSRAEFFHEGRALVEKDDKIGFIDLNGNLVIPAIYYVGDLYFKNGKVQVVLENGDEIYIDKDGNRVEE